MTKTDVDTLLSVLVSGDRDAARELVQGYDDAGLGPVEIVQDIFWPAYERLEEQYRGDELGALAHHCAIRMLRVLVDQNAGKLVRSRALGRSVLAICGPGDADDLGAQMAVDLLEVAGFKVRFCGGGIAGDEILGCVNATQPDVLLMFCSAPADLPALRQLVDTIREIGACSTMQIAVGGGVFNRAPGLAEELGADLWGTTPLDTVQRLIDEPARRASTGQRTVGRGKRKVAA